ARTPVGAVVVGGAGFRVVVVLGGAAVVEGVDVVVVVGAVVVVVDDEVVVDDDVVDSAAAAATGSPSPTGWNPAGEAPVHIDAPITAAATKGFERSARIVAIANHNPWSR